jgi:hypothetical protein
MLYEPDRICDAHHLLFVSCSWYPLFGWRSFAGVGISVPALQKARMGRPPWGWCSPKMGHPAGTVPLQLQTPPVLVIFPIISACG